MFTGLIQQTGSVGTIQQSSGTTRFRVLAPGLAARLNEGDSVSVSGVCLTALSPRTDSFEADIAQETIARTSLARLQPGHIVNLELPTPVGAPLGGHIVQGHVDGTGKLLSMHPAKEGGEDRLLEIEIPEALTRYVVDKGSIAVEGISLTVARVNGTRVTIAIIPHTFAATNLRALSANDPVNIEVDVLAKYAEAGARERSSLSIESLTAQGF
jgi:riboflavin synthase